MSRKFRRIISSMASLILFIYICFNVSYKANASVDKPELKISVSSNKTNASLGEDVEITYNIKPQPIALADINQKEEKEIVLVIDTSGSMQYDIGQGVSKLEALKVAAKEFINKFATEDKVKIGIVSYNYCGFVETNLVSTLNYSYILNGTIDNLKADGATNIGDGIRLAQGMLTNDASVKKYVIVMSDGVPTALTYSGYSGINTNIYATYWQSIEQNGRNVYLWNNNFVAPGKEWISNRQWIDDWRYYNYNYSWAMYGYGYYRDIKSSWNYYENTDNQQNLKYGFYITNDNDNIINGQRRNDDPNGYCLEYSKTMALKFIENKVTNYMIGFSNGSDASELNQIASSGGGTYYDAKDAESIREVYSQIGDQIKKEYTVDNVNLKIDLPQGIEYSSSQDNITIDGSNIKLTNIVYKLNEEKTQYTAEEVNIKIKIKVVKSGVYNIGETSEFSYNGFVDSYSELNKKIIVKKPGGVRITANKLNVDFDITKRIIPDNNGKLLVNSDYDSEYTITPKPIQMYLDERPKEIVLVVDISGSMKNAVNPLDVYHPEPKQGEKSRMELAKVALTNFVDKFEKVPNVKIGIVKYTDEANFVDFGAGKYMIESSEKNLLHTAIENMVAGGGTNIGEGMRKGLWQLSQNSNSKKYMVMMSAGEPSTYTVPRGNDKLYYEKLDNENGKLLGETDTNSGNNIGFENFYRYDMSYLKGVNYSKIMAQKGKDLGVNTFAIGFSTEAGVKNLAEIAIAAGGQYRDATKDEVAINDVYNAIGDEIKTDIKVDNVKFSDELPTGLQFKDEQENSISKDLSFDFVHKGNSVYEAEPVVLRYKIKADKSGDYFLDKAKIEYKPSNEVALITKSFNSLNVQVIDDYIVKQGLLYKGNTILVSNQSLAESYISKNLNTAEIAENTNVSIGALIKTSGQLTQGTIEINSLKNKDIKAINSLSVVVYKVNKDNSLEKTNINPVINKQSNNATINFTLPKEETYVDTYYIINYAFSNECIEGITATSEISSLKIDKSSTEHNFNLKIINGPDLF